MTLEYPTCAEESRGEKYQVGKENKQHNIDKWLGGMCL